MSLSWNCEFCTFHHKVPSDRCSMCQKPYQSRSISASETLQTKAPESNDLAVSTTSGGDTASIPIESNISTNYQTSVAKSKHSNIKGNKFNKVLNNVPNNNKPKNGVDSNKVNNKIHAKRMISNPYAKLRSRPKVQPKSNIVHSSSKLSTTSSIQMKSDLNNAANQPYINQYNPQHMQNQVNKNTQQNLNHFRIEDGTILKKNRKQNETNSITTEQGEQSESQSNQLQGRIQNQIEEQETKLNQQQHEQQYQQKPLDKSKLKPIRTFTMIPISPAASTTWIYPVNPKYPIRKYQLEITKKALFHNTLVSLPTGLGKTLIAAVVMYNYYRWFGNCANKESNIPEHPHQGTGKIVFCAPTRPLVSQQMEACYNIVNIPNDHIAEISGKISPSIRKQLWNGTSSNTYQPRAKPSLFFCTPQTLMQDIINQICPTQQIVCIVLDEAHKAKGEYAYVKVIQELQQAGAIYRILGLSATPGTNIQNIQQVIDNLLIEEIQVRLETDDDVKPYIHQKAWETIVVKQPPIVQQLEKQINHLIVPIVERLRAQNALFCGRGQNNYASNSLTSLSPYAILKAKGEYHQSSNRDFSLDGYFYALQTLIAWRNDLKVSGVGMVKAQMMRFTSPDEDNCNLNEKDSYLNKKPTKRIKGVLGKIIRGSEFQNLWKSILDATEQSQTQSQLTSPSPSSKQRRKKSLEKHNPKLKALSEILIQHFERANACDESSRAIVFSQWRDSVEEIVNALNMNRPLLKPRKFIGQGSQTTTGTISALESKDKIKKQGKKRKNSNHSSLHNSSLSNSHSSKPSKTISTAGMKQKEQQQVLYDFKKGTYNIIVCTSIGEEGLDIGEVDLIVNFDCLRSPIRMIQRTGRTGRKRNGRVICLVAEGQEEQRLRSSTYATKSLGRALKLVSSFKLKKIASMFPVLPVMEMKDIAAKDKYRLSQIGGHTPAKERARRRKRARGEMDDKDNTKLNFLLDTNAWQLSPEEEIMRVKLFGELPRKENTFSYQIIDGHKYLEFPKALRRMLTKARFRNVLLHKQSSRSVSIKNNCKPKNLVGTGSSRRILEIIERKLKVSSILNIHTSNQSTVNLQNNVEYGQEVNNKNNYNDNTIDTSKENEKHSNILSTGLKSTFTDWSQIFGSRKSKNVEEISMLPIASMSENYHYKHRIIPPPCHVTIYDLFTHLSSERVRVPAPPSCSNPENIHLLHSSDASYSADESSFSSEDSIDLCSVKLGIDDGTENALETSMLMCPLNEVLGKEKNLHEDKIHVMNNTKNDHESKIQDQNTNHDKFQNIENTQRNRTNQELCDLKNQNLDQLSQSNAKCFSKVKSDEDRKTLNEYVPSIKAKLSPLPKNSNNTEGMNRIHEKSTGYKPVNEDNMVPCLNRDIQIISHPLPMISTNIKSASNNEELNEIRSDPHSMIDATMIKANKNIDEVGDFTAAKNLGTPTLNIETFYLPTPPESSSSSCSDEEDINDENDLSNTVPLAIMKPIAAQSVIDTIEKIENNIEISITSDLQESKNLEESINCTQLESNSEVNQKPTKPDNHDFKDETNINTSHDKLSGKKVDQKSLEKISPTEDRKQTDFFIVEDNHSLNDQSLQKDNFNFHLPTQDSFSSEEDESASDINEIECKSHVETDNHLDQTSNDNIEKLLNEKDHRKEAANNNLSLPKKDNVAVGHSMSHSVVSSEDKDVCMQHPTKAKSNNIIDSPAICNTTNISKRKHSVLLSDNSSEFTGFSPVTKNGGSSQTPQRKLRKPSIDELLDTPLSIQSQGVSKATIFSTDIEKDASIVCNICKHPDSSETNPIIFCDGPLNNHSCNVAVHKLCYNVLSSLDDVEFWRCDTCEERHNQLLDVRKKIAPNTQLEKEARCKICNQHGGAMKRTPSPESTWVHPFCIYFSPNYAPTIDKKSISGSDQFNKLIKISEMTSTKRSPKQKNLCAICGEGGGFECSEPQCHASAHPYCALNDIRSDKKWTLLRFRLSETDLKYKNIDEVSVNSKITWKMFCHDHKKSAQQIIQRHIPRKVFCDQDKLCGYHDLCKKDIPLCDSLSSSQSEFTDKDSPPRRKRLRKVKNSKLIDIEDDALVDENTRQLEKKKRIEARLEKRQRAIHNNKFLDIEAGIETDEDIDGDVDEKDSISKIEYEEGLSDDSFINNTSQLGHSSQDSLEKVENKLVEGLIHRELDTKHGLENLLSTPILNRRMKKKKKEIEWDTPSPMTPRSRESLRGLGNMHFVRSVIEHHRKGGESTELEKEYNMLQEHGTQYAEDEDYYEKVNKKSSSDDESEMKASRTVIEILDPSEQSASVSPNGQTIINELITSPKLSNNELKMKENQKKSVNIVKNPYNLTLRKNATSNPESINIKAVKNLANEHVSSQASQFTNRTDEITETASTSHSPLPKQQQFIIHKTPTMSAATPTASTCLQEPNRTSDNINNTSSEKPGKSLLSESQRAMIAAKRREALLRRQQQQQQK